MTVPQEIELKLELPEQALAQLTRSPLLEKVRTTSQRSASLVSVYYDTESGKLRRHGLTLRVRHVGRRYIQTVKLEGTNKSALMDRGEWEHSIAGGKPNLKLARDTGPKSIFNKKVQAKLKPLFETRVRRKTYPIRSGGSEIELTIDKGTVASGRRSAPICEVELELKRGEAMELFNVARTLASQAPVRLAVTSKPERGFALLAGMKTAIRAAPIAILPDASCQAAFQAIARTCLHQILANQDATRSGEPEGLHQTRIGLRRLRAAMSLFGGMLLDPQSNFIKRELRWISGELGPARELDIFFSRVVKPATAGKPQQPGVATLTRDLLRRRRAASQRARSAMASDRFRALVLETAAWIEVGDWTRNADELGHAIRDQPIAGAAVAEMERRRKKLVKRGKRLSDLGPLRRHRMRIQTKKLRYAAEFFGVVFPGKKRSRRQKKFINALEQLQDTLGDLNDISVHENLTEHLANAPVNADKRNRRTADKAFAAGRLSGREEARVAMLLKDAERAYESFAKVRPFWR